MTTFQFVGTFSVSLPSLKPLKFKPPFSCVRPAVSWNVTVFAVVSTVSQVQSICDGVVGLWATQIGAESRSKAMTLECFVMHPKLPTDRRRRKDPHKSSDLAPARRSDRAPR